MNAPGAPGASASAARRHAPQLVRAGRERPITVDQTNRSVVVDDAVIVKWYDPPVAAADHRLDVLEHLMANGFVHVPVYFGAEHDGDLVVASICEFVPGALDGWDWFVDQLTGWVDGDVGVVELVADARRIGELGGELHAALATPSPVVPDPVGTTDAAAERDRCAALLREALTVVRDDAAAVLSVRSGAIAATIATIATRPTPTCVVHGDLHVGQFLRDPSGRLVITDFDGNPLVEPAARRARRPVATDVASLAQSVDHAGRVAARRRPEAGAALDDVVARCVQATLDGHLETLDRLGCRQLVDDRLLTPFRIAQELHELIYAQRHLPRWTYAPTATLRALLPDVHARRGATTDGR